MYDIIDAWRSAGIRGYADGSGSLVNRNHGPEQDQDLDDIGTFASLDVGRR